MKKTDITRVTLKHGEDLPRGATDWAAVSAMTDEDVLAAALSDPDAQPLDSEALAKMRRVSSVKKLRQRLAMTQVEFAEAFRLPISTLRNWEQHRSTPDAPARALLQRSTASPRRRRRLFVSGGLKTYPERHRPLPIKNRKLPRLRLVHQLVDGLEDGLPVGL